MTTRVIICIDAIWYHGTDESALPHRLQSCAAGGYSFIYLLPSEANICRICPNWLLWRNISNIFFHKSSSAALTKFMLYLQWSHGNRNLSLNLPLRYWLAASYSALSYSQRYPFYFVYCQSRITPSGFLPISWRCFTCVAVNHIQELHECLLQLELRAFGLSWQEWLITLVEMCQTLHCKCDD